MTDVLETSLIHRPDSPDAAWWRQAVIYQIYPRSWSDASGDGIGDLPGVTARLPYLRDLGVDAVWFSPFYRSPQADAGYDVADYRDIDPLFGTLADLDELLARAHELGLKVIVDLVPNHTSDEHAWFRAALAAGPGSPERARYVFRDGTGRDANEPPNDWRSVFGGTAWTRVEDGQWYLHLFDRKQPDLNWENAEVRDEFLAILRFWLDRGVDGFRVDVAHGLVKRHGLPNWPREQEMLGEDTTSAAPMWDQDGVHEIYEQWRRLLESYGAPDRIMCAEAWVKPPTRLARYVRGAEFHQAFNFDFLDAAWHAPTLRDVIVASLEANDSVGAPATWVLSNHDVVRHASRLGLPVGTHRPNGIGVDDPQPDRALGLRRARAATMLMLALPGSAYIYQGEELGLPESTDMPDQFRQDPTFARSHGEHLGRDGCRVPMPWVKDAWSFGFSAAGETWLPQPEVYGEYAVDQQDGVPGSTLELYRTVLRMRRERGLGLGGLRLEDGYPQGTVVLGNTGAVDAPDDALAGAGAGAATGTLVITNVEADEPVTIPAGAEVLLSSGPLTADGRVPRDTTVWVAP